MNNDEKTKLAKALMQLDAKDFSDVLFKVGGGLLLESNSREINVEPSGDTGVIGEVGIKFKAERIGDDPDDGYYNKSHLPEHDEEVETKHSDRKPDDANTEEKLEEIIGEGKLKELMEKSEAEKHLEDFEDGNIEELKNR